MRIVLSEVSHGAIPSVVVRNNKLTLQSVSRGRVCDLLFTTEQTKYGASVYTLFSRGMSMEVGVSEEMLSKM